MGAGKLLGQVEVLSSAWQILVAGGSFRELPLSRQWRQVLAAIVGSVAPLTAGAVVVVDADCAVAAARSANEEDSPLSSTSAAELYPEFLQSAGTLQVRFDHLSARAFEGHPDLKHDHVL